MPKPYTNNALEQSVSKQHGKHLPNLEQLIPGTEFETEPVYCCPAVGAIFNNLNHTLYTHSLLHCPQRPTEAIKHATKQLLKFQKNSTRQRCRLVRAWLSADRQTISVMTLIGTRQVLFTTRLCGNLYLLS